MNMLENSWPGGQRRPITQAEHDEWNRDNYPGTRQICEKCGNPTERCEYDSLYLDDGTGPLCDDCYDKHKQEIKK